MRCVCASSTALLLRYTSLLYSLRSMLKGDREPYQHSGLAWPGHRTRTALQGQTRPAIKLPNARDVTCCCRHRQCWRWNCWWS